MKVLLGILLLGNLIFFAFMQWGVLALNNGKAPLNQPALNAEKIKLIPASSVPDRAVVAPASAVISPLAAATSAAQAVTTMACKEWGEFSGGDLVRANKELAALNLGKKLAQRQVEYNRGYWAYIPPPKTRAEIDKKIAVLTARDVDHFVVTERGKWNNAISLGVFKTADAAHKFVDSLKAKAIKTAVVGERVSKLKFTVFVLQDMDVETTTKIKALQNEFSGSELKDVACKPTAAQLTSGG